MEKVVGPAYHITCDDSDAMYVGEMERRLTTWFSEHWRKSTVGSEVSPHMYVDKLEHGVSLEKFKILTVENRKFERTWMVGTTFFQQCGLTC